jgi:filamentous hemagglutinin family protein
MRHWRILFLLAASSAWALPEGAVIQKGDVTFQVRDGSLHVVASDGAIIDYNRFRIGKGERVEFLQPGKSSWVLNRVTGPEMAEILGRLESNGRLFLQSPSGILIGEGAEVRVGALLATGCEIVNRGRVEADEFIALVGEKIENSGLLSARGGELVLTGVSQTLDLGSDLLQVLIGEAKTVREMIDQLLSFDQVEVAGEMREIGGEIYLLDSSRTEGAGVEIEGNRVWVRGDLVSYGPMRVEAKEIDVFACEKETLSYGSMVWKSNNPMILDARLKAAGNILLDGSVLSYYDPIVSADGSVTTSGGYTGVSLKVEATGDITFSVDISITGPDAGVPITDSDYDLLANFSSLILRAGLSALENSPSSFPVVSGGTTFSNPTTTPTNGNITMTAATPSIVLAGTGGAIILAAGSGGGTISFTSGTATTLTSAGGDISLTTSGAGNITFAGTPTFTSTGGDVTLSTGSTGGITFSAGGTISSGGGDVTLSSGASSETVIGGNLSITSAGGDITISGGNFRGTVLASQDLTIVAGAGDVSISSTLGAGTRLDTITITSANNATFSQSIVCDDIIQTAGTGTTTFSGPITTNVSPAITATGTNFTFQDTITTTTGTGTITITPSGTLTLNGAINSGGTVTQNGAGATVLLGANINTSNDTVTFNGSTTLTADVLIDTNTGAGDIIFGGTVNGAFDLTLETGTGDITLTGAVGGVTPLDVLTITGADDITYTGGVSCSSLVQTLNGAGSITTINGPMTTSGAAGITMLAGETYTINAGFTTGSGGDLSIAATGTTTFANGLTHSIGGSFSKTGAGATTMQGTMTAGGSISFAGSVSLGGAAGVASLTAQTGGITFSSTLIGGGGAGGTLSASAPNGTVLFTGTIGGGGGILGVLTVNANVVTFTAAGAATMVTNAISVTATSAINFTAATYTSNQMTFTTAGNFNMNAAATTTFTSTDDDIIFNGGGTINLSAGTSFTVTTSPPGTGNIELANIRAVTGNLRTILLTTGSGNITLNQVGSTVANAEVATLTLTSTTGTFFLRGSIAINTTAPTFSRPTICDGTSNASVTTNNLAITFAAAATVNGPSGLIVNSGTAATSFGGLIGGVTPVGTLQVARASTVTLNGLGVGSLGAGGPFSVSATGAITMNTAYYGAGGGINLQGASIALTAGAPTTLESFGGAIILGPTATLSNGADLTIKTQGGNVIFTQITGNSFENLTISAGSGLVRTGILTPVNGFAAVRITGGNLQIGAPFTTTNLYLEAVENIGYFNGTHLIRVNSPTFLNAENGDIGTFSTPLFIGSTGPLTIGAGFLANINNPLLAYSASMIYEPNPPCILIYNGVTVYDCRTLSAPTGFYSSFFNLSSDFYFKGSMIEEDRVGRVRNLFWVWRKKR